MLTARGRGCENESCSQGMMGPQTYVNLLITHEAAIEPVVRLSAQLHKDLSSGVSEGGWSVKG